jgi:CDP-glucose 4,6-dehydratase
MGAELAGLALPPPTEPSLFRLAALRDLVPTTYGDIRDLNVVIGTMRAWQPKIVFHLAAQALVRQSYRDPVETYATNVMGGPSTACRCWGWSRMASTVTHRR